jgi:ATP/maltotriose-dependent transcriptional regulator MalT/DNA-binding XRE family transcriptional regulator
MLAGNTTFHGLLKHLRRRARLTQRDLALAVGYTEPYICRLEKNQRPPHLATLSALFVPALRLQREPELAARLLALAAQARGESDPGRTLSAPAGMPHEPLEPIPAEPAAGVARVAALMRLRAALANDKSVVLCGLAGAGKTALAARLAREREARTPVFWCTIVAGVTATADAIVRRLALFFLAHGQERVRPLVDARADARPIPLDRQLALLGAAILARPALLCFDDVHLLAHDPDALAVLRYLHDATPAALLLTSREDLPLPKLAQLNLAGLERDEAQAMIEHLGLTLAPDLRDGLIAKTGGNPMLLRLAAGHLQGPAHDHARFVARLGRQPEVSTFLCDTLLSALSPAARWLALLVCIFRRPIDLYDETLVALAGRAGGPGWLGDGLAELTRRHLIDHPRWAVLHPLVRDYLYDVVLAREAPLRRRLHRVAAQVERAHGDIVEAAYHACRAGDVTRAAEELAEHGEALFDAGRSQAAVAVVDLALSLPQPRQANGVTLRRRLLTARGDLLKSTLRAAEAEDAYREALALAPEPPALRADITRRLASLLLQRGQAEEALQCCVAAATALDPADTVLLARLAAVECRAWLALADYDAAERVARRALALADSLVGYLPDSADEVRVRAERTLGWIAYTRAPGSPHSLEHYRRALSAARRAGLHAAENACLVNIATALTGQGHLPEALASYEQAAQGAEALGDSHALAAILHNLGALQMGRGEPEAALEKFERACELERAVGDAGGLLDSENARGSTLMSLGRLAEARAVIEGVLADFPEAHAHDVWTLGSCLCTQAQVLVLQGDVAAAVAGAQRVLALEGVRENARIFTAAQDVLAQAHVAAGDLAAARRSVAERLPEDVGLELEFERQLVEELLALAGGDAAAAAAVAGRIGERAGATGYHLYGDSARRLLQAAGGAPDALVRALLVCV